MFIIIALSLQLVYTLSDLPSSTGKTFYKPLKYNERKQSYNVDVKIGEKDQQFKLWLSTLEANVGVASSDCTQCNFTDKWNFTQSSSHKLISKSESENMYYINEADGY